MTCCAALTRPPCDAQSKLARATEEKDFLKQLSDNLLSNQKDLQERIRVLEAASRETSGNQDAQIKVRAVSRVVAAHASSEC